MLPRVRHVVDGACSQCLHPFLVYFLTGCQLPQRTGICGLLGSLGEAFFLISIPAAVLMRSTRPCVEINEIRPGTNPFGPTST